MTPAPVVQPERMLLEERMPLYRVEFLDLNNRRAGARKLQCTDDVQAIEEARSFATHDRTVLLLQAFRPVTAFKPLPAPVLEMPDGF